MLKKDQKGFGHIGLLLLCVVVAAIGFIGWRVYKHQPNNGNHPVASSQDSTSSYKSALRLPSNLASCGTGKDLFPISPVQPSSIDHIEPLGHVMPTGHVFPINHVYLYLPIDAQRVALKTPVSSPGDITVYKIESFQYYADSSHKNLLRTDYQLSFAPCSDVSGFFNHLTSLSGKLLSTFTAPFDYCSSAIAGDETFESCGKYVNIKIGAGETIGAAGGQPQGSQSLDWTLEDFRIKPLEYANNTRFSPQTGRNYSRYIVCPLDYISPSSSGSLYGLLGGYAIDNPFTKISKRTTAPLCGTSAQDIPGTAQGNWFADKPPATESTEDPNLALVHDDVNTNIGVFSMGTTMSSKGLDGGAYYFTPSRSGSVNKDFNEVKSDGNIYCYNVVKKLYYNADSTPPAFAILLQLISRDEIKIEHLNASSCGSGPWNFSSAAQVYYR